MKPNEDIHAGHRSRMYDKLINAPDGLAEHEYLEIILFAFTPRVNTNPLAHRLLRTFGSLSGVFSATPKELTSVEGIGKNIASHIFSIGKIMRCVKEAEKSDLSWKNVSTHSAEIVNWFNDKTDETMIVVLIDEKHKEIVKLVFDGQNFSSVEARLSELLNAFAIHKPASIVIAHNHPSGKLSPSEIDDYTTKKFRLLCEIHGVKLIDHVIVHENEIFSYLLTKRMDYIDKTANLNSLINSIKE